MLLCICYTYIYRHIQFSYNWTGDDKLRGQFQLTKRERRCGQGVSTRSSSYFGNVGFSKSRPKTHKGEEFDFSAPVILIMHFLGSD